MKCKTLFLTSNQDDISQWIIIPISIACVEINRPFIIDTFRSQIQSNYRATREDNKTDN